MISRDSLLLVVASPGEGSVDDVLGNCVKAIAGGATSYWLRERQREHSARVDLARRVSEHCIAAGVALWIAGDVDLALAVDAAAVHLGFRDPSPTEVRRRLGSERRLSIGFSAHDPLDRAAIDAADHVTLSPLYDTTKPFAHPPLGEARFAKLAKQIPVPVVALGGISANAVERALAAGACGVAVMRGIAEISEIRARLDAALHAG